MSRVYLEPDTSGPAGEHIAAAHLLLLAHASEATILRAWTEVLRRPELAAAPAFHAGALADAGIAFLTLFSRSGNPDLLSGAIELLRSAGPLSRAVSYLGVAYGLRFERTGDDADLRRAVEHCNAAVSQVPADDRMAGAYLYNAAVQCERFYRRHGRSGLLDAAIDLLTEAVRITRPGSPVATAASTRLSTLRAARQAKIAQPARPCGGG